MSSPNEVPQPPQPPRFERRLNFRPLQIVGIVYLLILPVLAVLGVFGESFDSVDASGAALEMTVDYPSRFRYKMLNTITVEVHNVSGETLDTVTVSFDASYIDQFSTVTFTPSVETVTGNEYQVELTDIGPDETQVVTVEIQAERYWRHSGTITASPGSGEPVEVEISTTVFP